MRLQPFINNDPNQITNPDIEVPSSDAVNFVPEGMDKALEVAGLKSNSKEKKDIKAIFDKAGAGVHEIAKNVAYMLANGDTDAARLKACEIASRVQGIMTDVEDSKIPEIHINIMGSNNKTIVALVMPERN